MSSDRSLDPATAPKAPCGHARELFSAGIATTNELWGAVGRDFDHGIEEVAGKAGIPANDLARTLLLLAEAESAERGRGGFAVFGLVARHWLELLIAAFLAGTVLIAVRPTTSTAVVVVRKDGFTPFQLIGSGDVREEARPRDAKALKKEGVVGHYSLARLSAGSTVTLGEVSAFKRIPAGRTVLSLETEPVTPALGDGESVSLLLVWDEAGAPRSVVVRDVLALSVESGSVEQTVWAVQDADVPAFGHLLGNSQVFVLRGMRPAE